MNPSRSTDPEVPVEVSPPTARAIKHRLLERVADSDCSHLTIGPDQGDWQPLLPGVMLKVLHEHEGVMSYLLRLAPGASLPAHRHPVDEECVVLDGSVRVGSRLQVDAGGYHLAHRGALHARLHTDTGATLFLRGAVPEAQHVLD
ncbi:MAG: cupin domain-containing protein [Rubrivivax sp.]